MKYYNWLRIYLFFVLLFGLLSSVAAEAQLSSFETRVERAILKIQPSVVVLTASTPSGPAFGSGFVIDQNVGLVLTNYHVVARSKSIKVKTVGGNSKTSAELVHYDASRDLALVRLAKTGALLKQSVLAVGAKPRLGQFVIAIGSPGGYEFSTSLGIVSAVERHLSDVNSKLTYIQIDAAIYEGSSGGPLANLEGEVIGMNSRGGARGAAGFAIPADAIDDFLTEYREAASEKKTSFGYLGAEFQELTPGLAQRYKVSQQAGALVAYVHPESAAAAANLKAGDVLLSIQEFVLDTRKKGSVPLVKNYLSALGPGKQTLTVWRNGKEQQVVVALKSNNHCQPVELEGAHIALLGHSNNRCYLNPRAEFLEVVRSWGGNSRQSVESLRKGDLVIALDGNRGNLIARFSELLKKKDNAQAVAQVLREGTAHLVLVP